IHGKKERGKEFLQLKDTRTGTWVLCMQTSAFDDSFKRALAWATDVAKKYFDE
ncbi:unnamed protein product, partial [Prorocentrum cordatum]